MTSDNKDMLHGQILETVSKAKYLGVTITSHLQWNTHTNNISSTTNRSLGFIRRYLPVPSVKRYQLKSTLRLLDPFLRITILFGIIYTHDLHRHPNVSSVTDMLQTLGWRPLVYCTTDAKICMMYKIVYGLVEIPSNQYLLPVKIINRR